MRIIGFTITKIYAERKNTVKEKLEIKSGLNMDEISKEEIDISKDPAVKFNFTYSVATGKSSSSDQGYLIVTRGVSETISENYLNWDRPFTFSSNVFVNIEKGKGIFGFARNILDDINIKTKIFFQAGKRYTPQILSGYLENGRPLYESDYDNINGNIGENWFYMDIDIDKYFDILGVSCILNIGVRNIFNNLNSAIINPVTGRAYNLGDPTPNGWNDPLFPDLQAPLDPYPFSPARFLAPRQIKFGISFKL